MLALRRPVPCFCSTWRSAFTLLELMIVLALIALLVAMTWPTLRRPLERSATQEAARQLVEHFGAARLHAIQTGQTMALRYELGGRRFWFGPAELLRRDEPLEHSSGDADLELDQADPGDAESSSTAMSLVFDGELDHDVVFQETASADEQPFVAGSELDATLADEMAQTEVVQPLVQQEESANWSAPVLIYPTGRSENAAVTLRGTHGYWLTVTIRGLTGAITIGPLEHDLREGNVTDDELPGDEPLPPADFESSGLFDDPGARP